MEKQYSPDRDWLSAFLPQWDLLLDYLSGLAAPRALEVGTYEGRAAVHLMHAYPNLELDVIDNFYDPYNEGFEARFDYNMAEYAGRFRKIKDNSKSALAWLQESNKRYDFIYIDADHSYEGTKPDLEMCWEMLNVGGMLFLDDYNDHLRQNPFKFGVDSAVNEFFLGRSAQDDFQICSNIHTDYQFYVRKLCAWSL